MNALNISVFGLGYVGCVSAACLAAAGNTVVGLDVQAAKVETINQGISPIIEKDIDTLIKKAVKNKHLHATQDVVMAIKETNISIICVGTPSKNNGSLNLEYIEQVTKEIAIQLKAKKAFHVVMYRSTMLPGSTEKMTAILEKISGKKAGTDFGVCYNPEFLREGNAVDDYYHPARIIAGATDAKTLKLLKKMYQNIDAPFFEMTIPEAELSKYIDNTFHALKVSFANEVGRISQEIGIDSQKVMSVFVADKKLNISEKYFRPGFSYGGSCLPKDVRALQYFSSKIGKMPIINSIETSNAAHSEHVQKLFLQSFPKRKKVGVIGLSFKSGTDDLRESPTVQFVKFLRGEGYSVSIYDPYIKQSYLIGANKKFIEATLPQLSELLVENIDNLLKEVDILVISSKALLGSGTRVKKQIAVFDIEGLSKEKFVTHSSYIRAV